MVKVSGQHEILPERIDNTEFNLYRNLLPLSADIPQNIGLTTEDFYSAIRNHKTICVDLSTHKEEVILPILVPLEIFSWYNSDLIMRSQPECADIYYLPPLPENTVPKEDDVISVIKNSLSDGNVLLVESDRSNTKLRIDPIAKIALQADIELVIENLGGGNQERYLNQYIAKVDFGERELFIEDRGSLYSRYEIMVQEGVLPECVDNGPSLALELKDEEISYVWQMYKDRFNMLSEEHPVNAGYEEEMFKQILKDPDVVKVVNRVDSAVTTLCLFLTDIKQCPWLNEDYFVVHHDEAISSGNFLIFLGIVTDEKMQGNAYASDVVDLMTKVASERGSSMIITFECNEISQNVTPLLVQSAIENSGKAKVSGLDKPVSQLSFYTIRKHD